MGRVLLAGLSPEGLEQFEESQCGGKSITVCMVCRGYEIETSEFYRRIERERRGEAVAGWISVKSSPVDGTGAG